MAFSRKCVKLVLNPTLAGPSLGMTPEAIVREFTDGRVVSRPSEYWAAQIYGLTKEQNNNTEGHDCLVLYEGGTRVKFGVRSLTPGGGIKFQKSKFIGSSRTCSDADLYESLGNVDWELVVDICDSPEFFIIPVRTEELMQHFRNGTLTKSGWKRDDFYNRLLQIRPDNLERALLCDTYRVEDLS